MMPPTEYKPRDYRYLRSTREVTGYYIEPLRKDLTFLPKVGCGVWSVAAVLMLLAFIATLGALA